MNNGHDSQRRTSPEDRVPARQLIAYGFGGIIPIALFNIAGQLMILIGNISLGLSAFWLGVIMIIPRLWDAVSDPIVGHISDNTRTPWGRRRPFLLVGGIAVALSFVLMWWIPKGDMVQAWFPTEAAFQWFQLGYILFWLLVFFTACTVFEIPHGALGMEMSPDYHERTRLFSAKSFLGNLFAMSTPWLFALANLEVFRGAGGNEADGMRYVSMLIALLLIPLSFWWFFTVREPGFRVAARQQKTPFWQNMKHAIRNKTFISLVVIIFTLAMGFNFVAILGYYIPIFYLFAGDKVAAGTLLGINGTIWAITGLIAVFPLNWLSVRLGKRDTLLIAIGLMCMAQLSKIVCYNPDYPYLIVIPTILLSSGMLFFFTLGASMVGDVCDEDDLKNGQRSEGSFYSIYWWFIKMGTAFASLVTGMLIMFTHFDEVQVAAVDDLKGSLSEMQVRLAPVLSGKPHPDDLETHLGDALEQSQEFLVYLDREIGRRQNADTRPGAAVGAANEERLQQAKSRTRLTVERLQKVRQQLDETEPGLSGPSLQELADEATPLLLSTPLERAVLRTHELSVHLRDRADESRHDTAHFTGLLAAIGTLRDDLAELEGRLSRLDQDHESFAERLNAVEQATGTLTMQAPRTLLLMRVVEIGLPLLLSLLSIFFALRYSLSEERCYQIKAALKVRNERRIQAP